MTIWQKKREIRKLYRQTVFALLKTLHPQCKDRDLKIEFIKAHFYTTLHLIRQQPVMTRKERKEFEENSIVIPVNTKSSRKIRISNDVIKEIKNN